MKELSLQQFRLMITSVYDNMQSHAAEYSALDAQLGDGDHGEAMVTAFATINNSIQKSGNFKTLLNDVAMDIMLTTSGSTSTLLGAFFLGMSDFAPEAEVANVENLKSMFIGGLDNVMKNTQAKVGDKTMMDTLYPAVKSIENYTSDDCVLFFETMAKAAQAGAESTKMMKANFGRARNLGDKTIGHVDAGATSWAAMFATLAKTIQ